VGPETNQLLQQMLAFLAVIEAGSFTGAAERLGVAKSSISKQVRALEHYFGIRLLHRQTRKLTLTEEGRAILPHCQQMVQSSISVKQTIDQLKGNVEGSLNVSAPPGVGEYLIRNFLPDFLERYPSLIVNLHISEQVQPIIERNIDIALRVGGEDIEPYVSQKVGILHAQIFASPGYLKVHGTPKKVSDLSHHNCLLWEKARGKLFNEWLLVKDRKAEMVEVKGNFSSNSIAAIREAAIQGLGIIALTSIAVDQEVKKGQLIPTLEEYSSMPIPIYAVYSQRLQLPPKAKVFLNLVKPFFT
tara:strand:- start:412 stop:1314 length:903 start_codon:yes stop_codon:yes gene_type:complete